MKCFHPNRTVKNNDMNELVVRDACENGNFARLYSQWQKIPDLPGLLKMLGYTISLAGDIMEPVIDVLIWYGNEDDEEFARSLLDKLEVPDTAAGTVYRVSDLEYLARQINDTQNDIGVDGLIITDRQFKRSIAELCSIIAMRNQDTQNNPTDDLIEVLREPFEASRKYSSHGKPDDQFLPDFMKASLVAALAGIGHLMSENPELSYVEAVNIMYERGYFVWLAIYAKDIAQMPLMMIPCAVMVTLAASGKEADMSNFSLDDTLI